MKANDDTYAMYCEHRDIPKIGECSLCHTRIHPILLGEINSDEYLYIILECPECGEIFISKYKKSQSVDRSWTGFDYNLDSVVPIRPKKKVFYKKISDISEVFEKTYHQAQIAEGNGLDQIAGIGYRRSLEFLVKDYLKYRIPNKTSDIESKFLGKCIEMIDNVNIQKMAKGATWIGNDETHYIRKWENKDITDLKKLIDLTLSWMELEFKTEEYTNDMNL